MKQIIFIVSILLYTILSFSQTEPPSNLSGSELRNWLKTNWYDGHHTTLGYDNAREQMYGFIDKASDGQVYCVYTGFHQTASFTTYLNPINCEHSIPQSWFSSSDPMVSDIFHLYPTHQEVNSARGSYPFAEITDSQTDDWYIVNSSNSGLSILSSIPSSNIDNYSELNSGTNFEPRENHSGDLARAAFYFYTMYPTQAGAITNLADLQTLYNWHLQDPVDAWELQRNNRIETKQGNRNPYIDYPQIACRAWGLTCLDEIKEIGNTFTIVPNPCKNSITISSDKFEIQAIHIYNIIGKQVNHSDNLNTKTITIDVGMFKTGIYFIEITDTDNNKILKKLIKE